MAKLADNDQISPESVLAALLAHESESAQYVSGLSWVITRTQGRPYENYMKLYKNYMKLYKNYMKLYKKKLYETI